MQLSKLLPMTGLAALSPRTITCGYAPNAEVVLDVTFGVLAAYGAFKAGKMASPERVPEGKGI